VRDIVAVDFTPSGTLLASVCQYGIIRFWDPASGERLRPGSIRHPNCTSLRFLSESTLATAGEDGTVRVWNLGDGQQIQTLSGHDSIVSTIDVSPEFRYLASGGGDRAVVLWDLQSGLQLARFAGHTNAVSAVHFHPNGKILASADESGVIRFWDLETGLLTNSMNACPKEIAAIDFSPDGTKLAAAEAEGSIYLFRMGSGKLEAILEGHNQNVNDVAFSQDGTLLATASSDRTVALWEAQGSDRATIRAHDSRIRAMDWTEGGLITSDQSAFRRWDNEHLQQTDSWDIGDVEVTTIDQQANQKMIAVGTAGGEIYILQSTGTTILHSVHAHNDRIDAVRFSPDGLQLATVGKDRWVRLWEIDSMRLAHEIDLTEAADGHRVPYSLCFSHDGARLFCAGVPDGSIQTFRTSNLSRSLTLKSHTQGTRALSAHPTQPILASASADETIRLWNTEDLQMIATLSGHSGEVYDVRFDLTGRKLVSASEDQTVIVWDTETRSKFEVLEGHVGIVRSVRFDSSGDRLASAGDDGDLRIWDLKLADGSRYAMDYEKFRTDGLAFATNLPAISSRLDAPIHPPSMEISPASQLGALKSSDIEPARLLFWRSLLACNWSAAHLQWQSLPEDARTTEQLALGRAVAREVQSERRTSQAEFNDRLLQIAESTGDTQPVIQTARAALTLRSNPSKHGHSAAIRALEQLPPTAQNEKRRILQECLRFDLEREDLASTQDDLQALVSLGGQSHTSDRYYDSYAAKHLSALKASLSTENPIAVIGLRGLALVEYFRQANALSPFDSTLLENLLEALAQWESTVNPPLAIISSTSDWSYLDQGTDPGTAWNEYPFNDQRWGVGKAPLGFGSKAVTTTPLRRNASNLRSDPSWMTFHFRHTFPKPELGARERLLLHCDYDDGMIAYLNGREIGRANMPGGDVTIDTPASFYQSEPGRSTFLLKSDILLQENVVAVEVHQREPSSSDIYFDLNLSAIGATPDTYLASIDQNSVIWLNWGLREGNLKSL
ncbi:MAG: WD40 repeat domain-containing protein, partial [Verrucomicrobia bacterium]|nr:WD40 repeat domain-containing protein [Verrucomicrobiota bacterium]